MSCNDGDKRDWDAFSGKDQCVGLELMDDDYGNSSKRVCLEGGQEEGGSGIGGLEWEWPEFPGDLTPWGDQAMEMGHGEDVGSFGMGMSSFSQMQRDGSQLTLT